MSRGASFAFCILPVRVTLALSGSPAIKAVAAGERGVHWVHNLIVHSVVPLDLTGELYIAGEDPFFTLGILSDVPSVSLSYLDKGSPSYCAHHLPKSLQSMPCLSCLKPIIYCVRLRPPVRADLLMVPHAFNLLSSACVRELWTSRPPPRRSGASKTSRAQP